MARSKTRSSARGTALVRRSRSMATDLAYRLAQGRSDDVLRRLVIDIELPEQLPDLLRLVAQRDQGVKCLAASIGPCGGASGHRTRHHCLLLDAVAHL